MKNLSVDEKYELCYKHYLESCSMAGEKTEVTLETYERVVPISQIDEMIKYGYVGDSKIIFDKKEVF